MAQLSQTEIDQFWQDGYLLVENAVDDDLLTRLKTDFERWVKQSAEHTQAWGETIDGRARFDLEPGHTSESPKLRRVNAPVEVSENYFAAMAKSRMTDVVTQLIGPNVKFHHSKINSKLGWQYCS